MLVFSDAKGIPTGPVFGIFCAGAAVVMGMQTYRGLKEGWAYNGHTSRAFKKDEPGKFYFWISLQIGAVVFLAGMAIYNFASMVPQ